MDLICFEYNGTQDCRNDEICYAGCRERRPANVVAREAVFNDCGCWIGISIAWVAAARSDNHVGPPVTGSVTGSGLASCPNAAPTASAAAINRLIRDISPVPIDRLATITSCRDVVDRFGVIDSKKGGETCGVRSGISGTRQDLIPRMTFAAIASSTRASPATPGPSARCWVASRSMQTAGARPGSRRRSDGPARGAGRLNRARRGAE